MSRRAIKLAEPEVADCGFYGKVPARGDFVRSGLTGSFVAAWDGWAQAVLAGSRKIMGEAWIPAWLEAPVWRFALPGGLCGPETVAGLFLPSVDRVGRFFPLCFACLASGAAASAVAEQAGTWLCGAEAAGRAALAEDLTPEAMVVRLALFSDVAPSDALPPLPATPVDWGLWWTAGSPRVPPSALALPDLPDAGRFVGMLDAGFAQAASGIPG